MILLAYLSGALVFIILVLFLILLRWFPDATSPLVRSVVGMLFILVPTGLAYLLGLGTNSEGGLVALVFSIATLFAFRIFFQLPWNRVVNLHITFLVFAVYPAALFCQLVMGSLTIMDDRMYPTLLPDDRLIYNSVEYNLNLLFSNTTISPMDDPSWGDLIVMQNPSLPEPYFIEQVFSWMVLGLYSVYTNTPDSMLISNRIIALPGESFRMWRNRIYLDHNMLPLQYHRNENEEFDFGGYQKIYIEENHQTLYRIRLRELPTEHPEQGGAPIRIPKKGDLFRYSYDPEQVAEGTDPTYSFFINEMEISQALYELYYATLIPERIRKKIEKNQEYAVFVFTEDYYFVLNDDRDNFNTLDSRSLGLIRRSDILGKIRIRVSPFPRLELF